MDITELFFDQAHSPKLVYAFDPGDDVGNTTFRCERMNAAAELWIRENACDGKPDCQILEVDEEWALVLTGKKQEKKLVRIQSIRGVNLKD